MLLIVIIGAALLAFIIGDFFTSGRTLFGGGTTVAKVDGQKIDVTEFQRRMEQVNQQMQQSGRHVDQALLQQQVLSQLIGEKLYNREIERLGLTVTDDELSDAMLGTGAAYLDRMIQQQTGLQSASMLHDMAYNPVKHGLDAQQAEQLKAYWLGLEQQMEAMLLQQKFQTLLSGAITANELDAKAIFDDNAATSRVAFARKDLSTVPDDEYAVTDDEIKAAWNAERSNFAIDEQQRFVNYIAVEIVPSRADITAAEQQVEEAVAALSTTPDLEGIAGKNQFVATRSKQNASAIRDAQLKHFADTASTGRAAVVSRVGNDFTLAKVMGKASEVDTVTLDFFVIDATANIDSVLADANGATAEVLRGMAGVSQYQTDQKVSLIDPAMASLRDALLAAPAGRFFTPDTTQYAQQRRVFRVTSRQAPAPVYDLAVIEYTVEPSNATVNSLQTAIASYAATHAKAKEFADSALTAGYTAFPAMVSASTPMVGNLTDSRQGVSWAMGAKKGEVSPVFGDETTGRFLVLALNDVYDDYVPATEPQTRNYLTEKVRADKKAQALIGQYSGKATDLAGFATLMDSRVDTVEINFGQYSMYNAGLAGPDAAAQVAAAPQGKLTGPVKADGSVVVFSVMDVDAQGRPYDYRENAAVFDRTLGNAVIAQQLTSILLGKNKVENKTLNFFRD